MADINTNKADVNKDKQDANSVPQDTDKRPQAGNGLHGPIGEEQIQEAYSTFKEYKSSKANLELRIVENEQWWRLRHWETIQRVKGKENDPEPTSAWLFNSIINKHADAMDNFPMPNFLPREKSDEDTAKMLQKVIPCILDANGFEQTYSDAWWYKLKFGTVPYGAFWNSSKENGLGDVDIRRLDLLMMFWEPGIRDIQDSANLFNIALIDKNQLEKQYSFLEGNLVGTSSADVTKYISSDYNDNVNKDKVIVYDWYYKKTNSDGITVVHYCKFVEGHLLYASENDPAYKENGYYDHGMYPFIFDTMFPVEDSPVGFGYIDVMKSPQLYIDKLDQIILKNTAMVGKPRYFASDSLNLNIKDFADWSKDIVKVSGSFDQSKLMPIQAQTIPAYVINHMTNKIDELKETSGNRDFSQGSTQSGVTAASAIAALQEAGSKLSRDMIKTSYRAYRDLNSLVFEIIRQFYSEDRYFRIDGPNGGYEFEKFNNSGIKVQQEENPLTSEVQMRKPMFDIKVQAQKQSPFSRESQNEMAKEFYQLGVFNPQQAIMAEAMLEMTDFEGIEKIKETVKKNDTMMQAVQQLSQLSIQMAQQVDQATGQQNLSMQVAQLVAGATGQQIKMPQQQPGTVPVSKLQDSAGMPTTDNTKATQLRLKAAKQAQPK